MTEKIYLETFEKCPGSLHFPLLTLAMATFVGYTGLQNTYFSSFSYC